MPGCKELLGFSVKPMTCGGMKTKGGRTFLILLCLALSLFLVPT